MVFIRRFVWRETRIAIETIGAVLDCQMHHFLIEAADTLQRLSHTPLELLSNGLIFRLMRLKPSPIVVGHHLTEKSKYSFCIHFVAKVVIFPLTTK